MALDLFSTGLDPNSASSLLSGLNLFAPILLNIQVHLFAIGAYLTLTLHILPVLDLDQELLQNY